MAFDWAVDGGRNIFTLITHFLLHVEHLSKSEKTSALEVWKGFFYSQGTRVANVYQELFDELSFSAAVGCAVCCAWLGGVATRVARRSFLLLTVSAAVT